MKTTLFTSSLALLLFAGCVDDSPWRIVGTATVDSTTCGGMISNTEQLGGSLDIAPASQQETQYLLQFKMLNEINPPLQLNTNMLPMTTVNAGDINVKEAIISYKTTPAFVFKPAKESIAVGGVVPAAGSTVQEISMNIITQNAADTLLNGVAPGNTAELLISLQFHGLQQAGGDVYSTTVTYPIHVFNSGVLCTGNDTYGALGICGTAGGQDGHRVCCVSDPTCKASTTTP